MPMGHWLRAHYLTFTGRISRAAYIRAYALLFVAVVIVIAFGIAAMILALEELALDLLIGPPLAAGRALLLIGSAALVVQRFHDAALPTLAGLIYLAVGAAIAVMSTFVTGSVLMLLALLPAGGAPLSPGHWIWLAVWLVWFLLPVALPGMRGANRDGPAA
jgi:uncharacterized membrane protein YhaH (DUF805 family)